MADTCFCQNGLSQFKPLMAEIFHPLLVAIIDIMNNNNMCVIYAVLVGSDLHRSDAVACSGSKEPST